jgi:signal transduction histidine kinase
MPFEKVLRNLVGNALKHHDRSAGRVVLSAVPAGDMVEVRVADDGPGIPQEFHERVFRMFQTLRPRDEVEGSGAGLAIVKKTVETFGGRVHVESDGRGTCMVFTWPLCWARTEPEP